MGRLGRTAPFLVALVLVCRSAGAQGYAVALTYDVRWGPLSVLSMELTSRVGDDQYQATSVLQTRGLIGKVFPWRSNAESRGRRERGALRPEWHRSDGTYRSERRTVAIDYPDDAPMRVVVTPPPEEQRDVVPDELQQATVDPLTASLLTVGADCRGVVPVFDGRRRYDLRLEEQPPATVPRGADDIYTGTARRCRATVEARAGLWRDDPRESEKPTTLEFWIATPREGVPPIPVYLELSGPRGTLAMVLTRVRTLDSIDSSVHSTLAW
jgi:Protein of unknown function (DUF3108)